MSVLICGSFAYDTIMVFNDRFRNHILPDRVDIINVSFLVPDLRREFGGCAGNIAYNLKLLGGNPIPMGAVGTDFKSYAEWLDSHQITRTHIKQIDHTFTAQAFITTDMDDNQITAFHPGAMNFSHYNKILQDETAKIGMISPDGRIGMIEHARQLTDLGIPFIFDPGQGMTLFDGNDLLQFIEQATWITVNYYEWQLMKQHIGLSPEQVAERVQALIITKGSQGSIIYTPDAIHEIPSAMPRAENDPTSCGDAYRAGLLYGLMKDVDWETTGRIASLMGAIKIEHHGAQNHHFTMDSFRQRFLENFGYNLVV